MNILDHISENLEQVFGLKIFKFFGADPGSRIILTLDPGQKFLIRDKHPGSATLPVKGLAAGVYQSFQTGDQCRGSGSACFFPPGSDPLVTSTDPALDPSIINKISKENIDFYSFVTSL